MSRARRMPPTKLSPASSKIAGLGAQLGGRDDPRQKWHNNVSYTDACDAAQRR